jgi:hypothetical protein
LAVVLGAAALSSGCGRDRLEPPDPARPAVVAAPGERRYPDAGLRFQAPGDLTFDEGRAPLVTSTATGSASVAIWRYPRTEPLPRTEAELDDAERTLVDAVKTRDPTFVLDDVARVRVDGARGLEVLGTQRVLGRERRVRSTHVYAKGAELVVDAYSAPRDFAEADDTIFGPLVASLKIDPPAGG